MLGALEFDAALGPILEDVRAGLERVVACFDRELAGDLPVVVQLCRHIAGYRGKMLRPVLVLASGLASSPGRGIGEAHIVCAAVVEMVHMATLVHDDVLDEAESRRGAPSVSKLHGNEAAVILGDYLIASAYRLCSSLDSQRIAVLVGEVSRTLCAGELLQLHHRGDASIDEDAYFAIVERKTGSLIGLSCRLGAMASGAPAEVADRLDEAGRKLGIAFQIQDDVLDIIGDRSILGKPIGNSLTKARLLLPLIYLEQYGSPTAHQEYRRIQQTEANHLTPLAALLKEERILDRIALTQDRHLSVALQALERLHASEDRDALSVLATYAAHHDS